MRKSAGRGEGGFTLIELLIVTIVLPIVVGGIAFTLISLFSLQSSVSNRASNSADAQIVSANFVSDVQQASFLTTQSPSTPQCAPTGQVSHSAQVLGFQTNNGQTVISYERVPASGGLTSLIRYVCQNGANSAPITTEVVSSNVPSTLLALINCGSTSACASSPTYQSTWISGAGIVGIKLSIGETAGKDAFTYELTATPRVLTPISSGGSAGGLLPLLLLGTGPSVASCVGHDTLSVAGEMALSSTSDGAAATSGGASITAGSFYTADTGNPAGALSGNITTPAGSPNVSTVPPTLTSGPPLSDPYASFNTPQTIAMLTADGNLNTVIPDGNYHGPGIYTTKLTLSGDQVFASGIYIFELGIDIGNFVVSSARPPAGVLFYVADGPITTTNGGQSGFDLSPLSSPPSPIANMTIWQAPADNNPLELSGSNKNPSTVSGTIYAPGANVGVSGNGNLTAGAVVASHIYCNGGGNSGGISITGVG